MAAIDSYKKRLNARSMIKNAIKSGKLVKPKKCEQCGEIKPVEAHHQNYDKPLEIRWLCRECHKKTYNDGWVLIQKRTFPIERK